jgi:hypothetical protein
MAAPPLFQLDAKNTQSAVSAAGVTTADGSDLPIAPTRALYVGVAGDVKVDMADGTTVTFKNAPAGVLPVSVKRVYATGTAATNILALY